VKTLPIAAGRGQSAVPIKYMYLVIDQRAEGLAESLPLLSVSILRGVLPRVSLTDKEPRADDLSQYKVCATSDVIINRMSAFQGAVGIAREPGIVSPEYLVLRAMEGVEPRFLSYLIRSSWFVSEMIRRLRGIGSPEQGSVRTPRINPEDLGGIKVPLRAEGEQIAIANFLDREIAQIDALIAAKQRMVELLEERHVEWVRTLLRDLNCPFRRLRWLATIGSGKAIAQTELQSEGETPVYGGNGIMGYTSRPSMVRGPSLAVGRVGALCGNVHVVGNSAWITDNALWIRDVRELDVKFLALVLRAARLNDLADKTAQPLITGEAVKATSVPFPPPAVQAAVQEQVSAVASRVDAMSLHLGDQIGLLQERRQALITAAVTGEMDIPGVAT
jgi:type I restriction enzyme, S subunit